MKKNRCRAWVPKRVCHHHDVNSQPRSQCVLIFLSQVLCQLAIRASVTRWWNKSSPTIPILPKKVDKSFFHESCIFFESPKINQDIGLFLLDNLLPRRSKNPPIWSHWSWRPTCALYLLYLQICKKATTPIWNLSSFHSFDAFRFIFLHWGSNPSLSIVWTCLWVFFSWTNHELKCWPTLHIFVLFKPTIQF